MDFSVFETLQKVQRIQDSHSYLFWKIKPAEYNITIKNHYSKNLGDLKLSLHIGVFENLGKLNECIAREIEKEAKDILYLMENELATIELIKTYQYFNESFGFYTGDCIHSRLKYGLISKNYKYTLQESLNFSFEHKCELIVKIIKGYEVIMNENLYHGNLSHFNIHLDECHNIKIGRFLNSDFIDNSVKKYKKSLRFFKLIDKEFTSLEINLAQENIKSSFQEDTLLINVLIEKYSSQLMKSSINMNEGLVLFLNKFYSSLLTTELWKSLFQSLSREKDLATTIIYYPKLCL